MNAVDRAKNIIMQPKLEWPIIASEPTGVRSLYTQYIMVMAAIPAVMRIIRALLFGGVFSHIAQSVGYGIIGAIVGYILTLIMVYIVALIADALAPSMGGEKNFIQSLKLVAYSMTPSWVGSIFTIIPVLGWLIAILAAIYGIYVFYVGAGTMKHVPDAKVAGYMVLVVIAAIIVVWVIGAIVGALAGIGMIAGPGMMTPGITRRF